MSYFRPELERRLLEMLDGTDQAYADAMGSLHRRRAELVQATGGTLLSKDAYREMMAEFEAVSAVLREQWRLLGPGGGPDTLPGVYQFTVAGSLDGRPAFLSWNQGVIGGDSEVVRRLEELAEAREGQVVAIGDAHESETAHLADPLIAGFLMRELLGRNAVMTGVYPRIPPPPTGYRR